MDFASVIIRQGDRVEASGRVVRNETGDWFEPPIAVLLVEDSLSRTVRPAWRGSVRIVGADFDELTDRFERDGAVEGYAWLTGIWTGSHLQVEQQAPPRRQPRQSPRWKTPPCPPPRDGWPRQTRELWRRGGKNLDFDLGDLRETGAAVAVTTFRPGKDQAVLVVAAADPEAVEAQLRPQLGQLLCIVPSKWTMAEFKAVRAHLHAHFEDWNLYRLASRTTEDGQAHITAFLTRMLPEVAGWAASLPAGILDIEPWLTRAQL
jgi:hypothetical protein